MVDPLGNPAKLLGEPAALGDAGQTRLRGATHPLANLMTGLGLGGVEHGGVEHGGLLWSNWRGGEVGQNWLRTMSRVTVLAMWSAPRSD